MDGLEGVARIDVDVGPLMLVRGIVGEEGEETKRGLDSLSMLGQEDLSQPRTWSKERFSMN